MNDIQQKRYNTWQKHQQDKIAHTLVFIKGYKSISGQFAQLNNLHLSTLCNHGYTFNQITDTYEKE